MSSGASAFTTPPSVGWWTHTLGRPKTDKNHSVFVGRGGVCVVFSRVFANVFAGFARSEVNLGVLDIAPGTPCTRSAGEVLLAEP